MKVLLYFFQVLSDDVETQKQGFVFIVSADVKTMRDELEDLSNPDCRSCYIFLQDSLPVRSCAFHFCLPNDGSLAQKVIWALFMVQIGSAKRVRSRFHGSSPSVPGGGGLASTEVQYRLMTFGINVQDLPVTSGGQMKTKNHLQWIKTRKAIELVYQMETSRLELQEEQLRLQQHQQQESMFLSSPSMMMTHRTNTAAIGSITPPLPDNCSIATTTRPSSFLDTMIFHPGIHDILLLKGGSLHHWGNIEFQCLLAARVEEYSAKPSRSMERKDIRAEIIHAVHDRGGRFLLVQSSVNGSMTTKSSSGGSWWVENRDLADLHDRISTALYDLNRKLERKKKMQISNIVASDLSSPADHTSNYKRRKLIGMGTEGNSSDEEDYSQICASIPICF
jgi:hypothetical protein